MHRFDFLMILRQNPDYSDVPVIALTAYAMIGDKEEFLAAGCDYYLAKPFSKANLMEVLEEMDRSK